MKKLKRALKKNGLKTTGKKSTLTKRARKAHLKVQGGVKPDEKPYSVVEGSLGEKKDVAEPKDEPKAAPPKSAAEEGRPSYPVELERSGGRYRRRGSRRSRGFRLF